MQKAGEQAAQDTSTNVNTANVNAMNRDQARQQLAQAKEIGDNIDHTTETNIIRGENMLGGASAKDIAITDAANAAAKTADKLLSGDKDSSTSGDKNLAYRDVKEYMPGLNIKDAQKLNDTDFSKGWGKQSDDVKRYFYTDAEWKKLNSKKTTEQEKIALGIAAKARYDSFIKSRG
jgi:hypothetical protein